MTKRLITSGRTDLEDYFRLSGVLEWKELKHSPFLVFVEGKETIEIKIVKNTTELLNYADETKVMAQWKGEWRSDFFQFTVGQVRAFLNERQSKDY